MLTADLVRATVRDGTLHLTEMKADARRDAVAIADEMIALARAMVGEPIDAVHEAFAGLERPHRLEKVVLGLEKLLLDVTETEAPVALDPADVRARVFERAAGVRKQTPDATSFDRDAVIDAVAAELETTRESIEQTLFADLKGERRLLEPPAITGEALVHAYEIGLEQAVLLRAERIVVEVRCSAPASYRALFRKLKFLRLLCTVDAIPGGAYRLTIDGPYSLFESTTRYGFELAMLVPLLRECDRYELDAVVRWGAAKERVHFHAEGRLAARTSTEVSYPEELKSLVERFGSQFPDYEVGPADTLVELDGGQILVPDLAFVHRETGETILLELLGYWSRAAVWKRVELAADPRMPAMIFAVPSRLRVSEEVLPDDLPACLYSFKGTIRPNAIHERLEQLRRVREVPAAKASAAKSVTAKPKRSRSRA